nr:tetratricopeptide repeat protein [Pseudomonas sp. RIT-PI-AD]
MLAGCSTPQRGAIPVVDSGAPLSNEEPLANSGGYRAPAPVAAPRAAASVPQNDDSGVVVMVPGGAGASSAPIQAYPAAASAPISSAPITPGPVTSPMSSGSYSAPAPASPSGIPANGGGALAADEQLDGPVLALLTTAQQQQGGGDLNGASSSLERAQRIAPREPQVLYRLAEVRLAQGDAEQAEQFAQRGLTYANGRPALQASLWGLIAQARERRGDAAGAAQAREKARVTL